ncbi:uncharacterized protein LOC141662756 [Apium graveolens]|uniref:uncharacterized protein LOC141662756 n=1 Tax=Apium graveolens TaxID=4045 RepID=UPI003D7B9646
MQAVKEKLQDMNHLRKAKAEAKDEEKAEKEFAKARLEVAREERLAKEAEAMMKMHVERATEKAAANEKTLSPQNNVVSDSEIYSMSVNSSKSGKLTGNSSKLVCGSAIVQEPWDDYSSNKSGKLIGNCGKLLCSSAGNQEPSDECRRNKSGMLIGNSSKLACGSAGYQEPSDDYRSNSVP